jgi:hypothetical protein
VLRPTAHSITIQYQKNPWSALPSWKRICHPLYPRVVATVAALGGPEVCKAMPRKFKLSTVVLIDIAAVQLIPYECFSI